MTTTRWKPNVTVDAIIERDGSFLLIEEHTAEGLRINNPAGHLEEGESLVDACARETLEETTHLFKPSHLVGVYASRIHRAANGTRPAEDMTYLRFAFCGELGAAQVQRSLDIGIVRTLWMTPDDVRANIHRLRSPLVLRCIEDYLRGQRYPIDLIYTNLSVYKTAVPLLE